MNPPQAIITNVIREAHLGRLTQHLPIQNFKRVLCATTTAVCLVAAPVSVTGVGSQAMAQSANPTNEDAFATMADTARFLTQSTFGPKPEDVISLTGSSPSQWLLTEFSKDASLYSPIVSAYLARSVSPECEDVEFDDNDEDEDFDVADADDAFSEDEEEFGLEDDGFEAEDFEDEDFEDEDDAEVDEDEGEVDDADEDEEGDGEEDGDGEEGGEDACEEEGELSFVDSISPNLAFWVNAISAPDQVRQRMTFALSQILVISNSGGEFLSDTPPAVAYYQDILANNALGNYRDLLEAVTYSPAMGYYLTYLANKKGDVTTGRVPDENYARELMQLFTIGLVELNLDGTAKTDANGDAIETYTNADITGLARVFTGLATQCGDFEDTTTCDDIVSGPFDEDEDDLSIYTQPMKMFESQHSELEKSFLGTTISAGTSGTESITRALDIIFDHPNVAPFVGRQLIQRLVTSHPSPAYIERVATAFEAGSYALPDGSVVGDARRGDLKATVAAIFFDDDARDAALLVDESFGKVREPVIRFTNWARAFNVTDITPEYMPLLWETGAASLLGQQPFGASSVFNFYRPGYVAPGTLSGAAGLTVPELQLVNAATTPGYINFMTAFITEGAQNSAQEELQEFAEEEEINLDGNESLTSFRPNYDFELELALDAEALVDRVEAVMTYITLSPESKAGVIDAVNAIPLSMNDDGVSLARRVHLAILMVMTTPDYLVQR